MDTALLVAARAYATLKGSLALVGLAVLTAFLALPQQRDALLRHVPSVAAVSLAADPSVTTLARGPIQSRLTEGPAEHEQRGPGRRELPGPIA